jgi:hypothetical protein
MLPASGGGPVCALPLHACTSVTPAGCCADPMATPSRTWPAKRGSVTPLAHLCLNPTPPDPKWHPPNGVKGGQTRERHAANRAADASQRALARKASSERKETPARRGANSRPLNAGRRTTSVAAVAALCCCVVRKDPLTQVHPANLAGGNAAAVTLQAHAARSAPATARQSRGHRAGLPEREQGLQPLVALTAATASIPGSRPSSSAASQLSSDTNLRGPAWISA